jgi:hypothetical protein
MRAQPSVRRGLSSHARRIGVTAAAIAPANTGDYKSRFVVGEEHGAATLGNTDFAAHLIEFGSVNNPPYAPIRRAVLASGMRFVPHPK